MELIAKPRIDVPAARLRLALFPAAFHPPTAAHEALIRAALTHVDAVLLTLARELPHKSYSDVGFDARLQMVMRLAAGGEATGVAVSTGGLFIDIAREAGEHFPGAEISILCGRDAAERALAWDYGKGDSLEAQLAEYSLLVAARSGEFEMPPRLSHLKSGVRRLDLDRDWSGVSASEVRRRIAAGEAWSELVPSAIADLVEEFYS